MLLRCAARICVLAIPCGLGCGFSETHSARLKTRAADIGSLGRVTVRLIGEGQHHVRTSGISRGSWEWSDSESYSVTWSLEVGAMGAADPERFFFAATTMPSEAGMNAQLQNIEIAEQCQRDRTLAARFVVDDTEIPFRYGTRFVRLTVPQAAGGEPKVTAVPGDDCESALRAGWERP